jgi:hypothetical protein
VGTELSTLARASVTVGTTDAGTVTVNASVFVPITVDPDFVVTVTVADPDVEFGSSDWRAAGIVKAADVAAPVPDATTVPARLTDQSCVKLDDARGRLIVTESDPSNAWLVFDRVGVVALGIVDRASVPDTDAEPKIPPGSDADADTDIVFVPSALCPTVIWPDAIPLVAPTVNPRVSMSAFAVE